MRSKSTSSSGFKSFEAGDAVLLGLVALLVCFGGGCKWTPPLPQAMLPPSGFAEIDVPLSNPLMVPMTDREFLWNQIVDTVDDYFYIENEERVKLVDGILTEGRLDTFPTIGSTLLEPWGRDSSPGFERLHATFQSIRRDATIRVTPIEDGYLIYVTVEKEKEELTQPEHATVGNVVRRHDGSLVRRDKQWRGRITRPLGTPQTLGWIPIGRDFVLEQTILNELRGRLLAQY